MGKMFQKAIRQKLKLRMAIDGPSGSGKTYTALRQAMMVAEHYDTKVAVIETEHKSASKYLGENPDGIPFAFDDVCLSSFSPTEYTSAIEAAEREGYGVLVIDSLSHAWEGKDGALEQVDKKGGHNKFAGWKDVTPMHRRMVEAILASKCHSLSTMRSKTEYVMEESTNAQGKTVMVPRKVAMAPIQRAGMEYEFDIYGSMDWSNTMTITKSRCSAINGLITYKPGRGLITPIIQWLETGEVDAVVDGGRLIRVDDETLVELTKAIAAKGIKPDDLKKELIKRYQIERLADLTPSQAKDFMLKRLGGGRAIAGGGLSTAAASKSAPAQVVTSEEAGKAAKVCEEALEEMADEEPGGAPASDDAPAPTIQETLEEVMADPAATVAKAKAKSASTYISNDDPVSKPTLAGLNRAIARLIKSGDKAEMNALVLRGIRKRNERATGPGDLTEGQADELLAVILKRLDGPHENPQ